MLIAKNRNFRLLFSATAVSNLGDGISALAFPWLASLLTRDPVLIGAVAAAARLPWLVFTIPAGVITDRADRRRLMVGADVLRFALTLAVVGLVLSAPALPMPQDVSATGMIWALAVAAFLLGTAEVVRDNAAQTALPSIVDPDQLEHANGQLWTVEEVMGKFVGPPLAGLLIALAVPVPFLADAATFAVAAALVWAITLAPRPRTAPVGGFVAQMADGMVWLWRNPYLLWLAIFLGAVNFLYSGFLTLLVLVGQEVLGLNAAQYGILLTTGAAGGVLGGLIGARVIARLGGTATVALALCGFLVEPAMVAFTSSAMAVGAGLFVSSLASVHYNIVTVSYRQRIIPDGLLGRVNSLYRFFGWGAIPLGALTAGVIVSMAEPGMGREAALRAPYLWGLGAMTVVAILGWTTLRFPKV